MEYLIGGALFTLVLASGAAAVYVSSRKYNNRKTNRNKRFSGKKNKKTNANKRFSGKKNKKTNANKRFSGKKKT